MRIIVEETNEAINLELRLWKGRKLGYGPDVLADYLFYPLMNEQRNEDGSYTMSEKRIKNIVDLIEHEIPDTETGIEGGFFYLTKTQYRKGYKWVLTEE